MTKPTNAANPRYIQWLEERRADYAEKLGNLPRRYAIVQTLTTDLRGETCEVALVREDGQRLSLRCRPHVPFSAGATLAHGLTSRDLQGEPELDTLLPVLRDFAGSRQLLTWNPIHPEAIARSLRTSQWPEIEQIIDVQELIKPGAVGSEKPSIDTLLGEFGIPPRERGSAVDSAMAVGVFIEKMLRAE